MSPEGKRPGIIRRTAAHIADIPSRIRDWKEKPALERARREGEEANRRTEMLAGETDRTLASDIIFNHPEERQRGAN